MDKWFQEGAPSSYKIQVEYLDIPQHMKLNTKTVDTPFRFKSFEEAQSAAEDMFNGFSVKIVGSKDTPHWTMEAPKQQIERQALNKKSWYDLYGVSAAGKSHVKPKRNADYKISPAIKSLAKTNTVKTTPGVRKQKPTSQRAQKVQKVQKSQKVQKVQKVQRSQ